MLSPSVRGLDQRRQGEEPEGEGARADADQGARGEANRWAAAGGGCGGPGLAWGAGLAARSFLCRWGVVPIEELIV